ncbi:MAG TPA: hypothetical protein PKA19_07585 [Bacillota bacterium]|nr:hypothetical protein [Bacillota bacterium]
MRITNKMITNSYSRNLNKVYSDMNKLSTQVYTQRKFSKSSEDTAAAISAYQIRQNLSKAQDYKENILHAQDFLNNSESVLTLVNGSVQDAVDKIRASLNSGTISSDERDTFATELKAIRDQIMQTMNSNSTGMYIFGGSNTVEQPFGLTTLDPADPLYDSLNPDKTYLTYNGQLLKNMSSTQANALAKDGLTVDTGMGLTIGAAGKADPNSVFTYSITGIEVMSAGYATVGGDQVPNNLYDLLGCVVDELEKPDGTYSNDKLESLFGKVEDASNAFLLNITKIGAKTSYLDFMSDRYDTQILSLQERQNHVEVADPALTLISFSTQKVAYQTALQMGADMIQPSIFNFMD